jgi:predicted regulator of Ras-like GTPase activity (Roadblock/LC7/MglB family)
MPDATSRSSQLDRALADLLAQASEIEAAAVVSFDGLPMASALPATMDEDRVAAMSAALLSLGERAAEGLGRGGLNQVYIEGDNGTVFLVSADDEAVLVAVAAKGAKVGMMLYEVRRAAQSVAAALRIEDPVEEMVQEPVYADTAPAQAFADTSYVAPSYVAPTYNEPTYSEAVPAQVEPVATYAPATSDSSWPSYLPNGNGPLGSGSAEPPAWS